MADHAPAVCFHAVRFSASARATLTRAAQFFLKGKDLKFFTRYGIMGLYYEAVFAPRAYQFYQKKKVPDLVYQEL